MGTGNWKTSKFCCRGSLSVAYTHIQDNTLDTIQKTAELTYWLCQQLYSLLVCFIASLLSPCSSFLSLSRSLSIAINTSYIVMVTGPSINQRHAVARTLWTLHDVKYCYTNIQPSTSSDRSVRRVSPQNPLSTLVQYLAGPTLCPHFQNWDSIQKISTALVSSTVSARAAGALGQAPSGGGANIYPPHYK